MREFRLDTTGPDGDCAVLQVTGEVDVCTAPMLRDRIRELAASGAVHLIADLGQVDFLDSTGTKAFTVWPSVTDAITAEPHWRKAAETGSVHEWCRQHGVP